MKRQKLDRVRALRERILFAVEVHGARALQEHSLVVQWMLKRDRPGIVLLRDALHEAGMPWRDINDLLDGGSHHRWCACWRCVTRLCTEVMVTTAKRAQQFDMLEDQVPDCGIECTDDGHFRSDG